MCSHGQPRGCRRIRRATRSTRCCSTGLVWRRGERVFCRNDHRPEQEEGEGGGGGDEARLDRQGVHRRFIRPTSLNMACWSQYSSNLDSTTHTPRPRSLRPQLHLQPHRRLCRFNRLFDSTAGSNVRLRRTRYPRYGKPIQNLDYMNALDHALRMQACVSYSFLASLVEDGSGSGSGLSLAFDPRSAASWSTSSDSVLVLSAA